MKILGFLLITLSSAVCGICYSSGKKDRIEELGAFCFMLELMEAELMTSLCSIPELSKKLAVKTEGKARAFLKILSLNLEYLGEKAFYVIWCESLEACINELNEKEVCAVKTLGNVLGKYDVNMQCSAIKDVKDMLRASVIKDSAEFPQLKRLSLGVSMSVGAMLSILLV